jgi:hypothetical protein
MQIPLTHSSSLHLENYKIYELEILHSGLSNGRAIIRDFKKY